MAALIEVIALRSGLSDLLFCSYPREVMTLYSLLFSWILKVSLLRNQISPLWTMNPGGLSVQWSISLELYLHDFPYLMILHQQDKHTCKVESSSLSSWIRNSRKQVQEAGGNSGEQDAASVMLILLNGPMEVWEEGMRGLFSWLGSHNIQQVCRRGMGGCLRTVLPEALVIKSRKRHFV